MNMAEKKCPPFCNPDTCHKQHHALIVQLVNIDDNDKGSLKKFVSVLDNFKDSITQELPIPDTTMEYNYPVLHWASVLGKITAVKYLISSGYESTVVSHIKGETALHRVVLCLHHFMQCNRQKAVIRKFKTLTDLLADALFVQDDSGNTPLHNCAILCKEDVSNLWAGLHRSALDIMIDKIIERKDEKLPIESGLNLMNREKKTVLHILVAGPESSLPLIRKFLECGADPYLKDKAGKSAIDVAKERKDKQMHREIMSIINRMHENGTNGNGSQVPKTRIAANCVQDMVTSTTTKDELEETDPPKKRFRSQFVVKPSLVSDSTKTKSEPTGTSVTDAPSSSMVCTSPRKQLEWAEETYHMSSRAYQHSQNDEEHKNKQSQPRLELLLKMVNQEKQVLDSVKQKREELKNISLKNEAKLTELKKEQAKLQEQHQAISVEIQTKMEAIRKLQEIQLKFEEKIHTLEDEFQKENEKNLKIMDDLDNYDKIISCITSVSQED